MSAASRFPPPWSVVSIPGGWLVEDANKRPLAYVYGRDSAGASDRNLTLDEARRIAAEFAKMPELLELMELLRKGGDAASKAE